MANNSKQIDPAATQFDRFKETACALGCDEDEAVFKAKLGKIASVKPPKDEPKK